MSLICFHVFTSSHRYSLVSNSPLHNHTLFKEILLLLPWLLSFSWKQSFWTFLTCFTFKYHWERLNTSHFDMNLVMHADLSEAAAPPASPLVLFLTQADRNYCKCRPPPLLLSLQQQPEMLCIPSVWADQQRQQICFNPSPSGSRTPCSPCLLVSAAGTVFVSAELSESRLSQPRLLLHRLPAASATEARALNTPLKE